MQIEFLPQQQLYEYYTGNYQRKQPFSENILKAYRRVVQHMILSDTLNDLSAFRSLNIEKYGNHWSAQINDQFRLEFQYIKPDTIQLIKISKHYE